MASKKKLRGENKPLLFHIRIDSDLDTLYNMGLFHAFEQQSIDSCVPLFNEKAAAAAMIRHGMDIQHNITEYLNPG